MRGGVPQCELWLLVAVAGSAAPLAVRAHFVEGRTVGMQVAVLFPMRCSKWRYPPAMMVVDLQHEGSPQVLCLFRAGPVPEGDCFCRTEIARKTQLSRPEGHLSGPNRARREGVHNVHTLGFGLGRTGAELGRIADVSGNSQRLQGLEPGSSPTSGTCFPCSGACEPLSVHKLFTYGPLRGLFLLAAGCLLSCVGSGRSLSVHGG